MLDLGLAYVALRDQLNAMASGWELAPRGQVGPNRLLVRLGERHTSQSAGHVDIEVVLDESDLASPRLWDCLAGFGATPQDQADSVAYLWSQTTASAFLELKLSGRGAFAAHFRGVDRGGIPGWHVIAGALLPGALLIGGGLQRTTLFIQRGPGSSEHTDYHPLMGFAEAAYRF